ncbi:hypothetical protein [Mucilaginibacter myungsuensis]|uniref:DUF2975 domain-containing protein n=1 Tax=Mucilaginibacter myungsuensis TaxID=649104 RepID=A0A929PVJ5_9SPHI|nr:hypothetical protein [Mucilaginibacter myungsuensis]MBE9661848.1 hypothetical protein [Mucilaginibacter myungsuensis]MDN3599718.1 hypothetical protein [Mucilaginibacter myungsuensis]
MMFFKDELKEAKFILMAVAVLAFVFSVIILIASFKPGRQVSIKTPTAKYGVVVVGGIKYHTSERWQSAVLQTKASTCMEYFLLSIGSGVSIATILIFAIGALLVTVLLYRIDLHDPFKHDHSKLLHSIFLVSVLFVAADKGSRWYTTRWVVDHFHGNTEYGYAYPIQDLFFSDWLRYLFYFAIFTAVLALYKNAIKNKQEIDLTV